MSVTTQRGEIAAALAQLLGVTGKVELPLDESILNTLTLYKLDETPYQGYSRAAFGYASQAAVALNYSYILLRAGPQARLRQLSFRAINPAGGTAQLLSLRALAPADIAALTLGTIVKLSDLSGQSAFPASGWGALASEIIPARHTALVGTQIDEVNIAATPANSAFTYTFQFLRGDDPAGRGALAIAKSVVNEGLAAGFAGLEYPIR